MRDVLLKEDDNAFLKLEKFELKIKKKGMSLLKSKPGLLNL